MKKPRAEHFGCDQINLTKVSFTPELLEGIPADLARRYQVLPVLDSPRALKLALADPSDLDAIDSLHDSFSGNLEICVAEASQITEFVNRFYGPTKDDK